MVIKANLTGFSRFKNRIIKIVAFARYLIFFLEQNRIGFSYRSKVLDSAFHCTTLNNQLIQLICVMFFPFSFYNRIFAVPQCRSSQVINYKAIVFTQPLLPLKMSFDVEN